MAKNGKAPAMNAEIVDSLPQELEESKEKLDAILDARFQQPHQAQSKQIHHQ